MTQSNQQAFTSAIHPCAFAFIGGSKIESRNTQPHACESGEAKSIDDQSHDPSRERTVEECDSIDALKITIPGRVISDSSSSVGSTIAIKRQHIELRAIHVDKRIRKDLYKRFPTAGIASGGGYGDK